MQIFLTLILLQVFGDFAAFQVHSDDDGASGVSADIRGLVGGPDDIDSAGADEVAPEGPLGAPGGLRTGPEHPLRPPLQCHIILHPRRHHSGRQPQSVLHRP